MVEADKIVGGISEMFNGDFHLLLVLLFFTAVIVIYAVFVYYFYRFLAKKNLVELNLNKYNQSHNPALAKFFAGIFYIIEYIIILPVMTFFWFSILAILILILSKGMAIGTILLISAALVAAVRITAYLSENLSRDLAKMLPFTLLAIAITTTGFFEMGPMMSRISEVPSLFKTLPLYLLFIVGIELIMRTFSSIEDAFKHEKEPEEEPGTESEEE